MFIQKLLGFIDLGREVRTPASIGVVEEHELAVLLADFVFVKGAFTAVVRYLHPNIIQWGDGRTGVRGSGMLRDGSFSVRSRCRR